MAKTKQQTEDVVDVRTQMTPKEVATALFEGLGGRGRVVGLEGPPSAPTSRDRVRGLKETLARFPNIEMLGLAVGQHGY